MSGPNTQEPPRLADLLIRKRFSLTLMERFVLFVYAPVGIVLVVLRLIMAVHIFFSACILRKLQSLRSMVLRVMSCLLGLCVWNDQIISGWDGKTKILVANHVSRMDHIAVDLVEPCMLPASYILPHIIKWCMGHIDFGGRQERDQLISQARYFCSVNSIPLLIFPEGSVTSGRKGLLKFTSWPFEVTNSVQPVVISINRPLFDGIAPSVVDSAWWQDIFYLFFVPITIVKVRWLQPMHRRKSTSSGEVDETSDEFAQRVASVMANDLGVTLTEFTSENVKEELIRHIEEQRRRQTHFGGTSSLNFIRSMNDSRDSSEHLDSLTMTIKQAFPAVPLLAIRNDLDLTHDANITCDRIAAGHVKLSPAEQSVIQGTAASIDAEIGQKLFKVRKWNLIDENRTQYLNRLKKELSDSGNQVDQ